MRCLVTGISKRGEPPDDGSGDEISDGPQDHPSDSPTERAELPVEKEADQPPADSHSRQQGVSYQLLLLNAGAPQWRCGLNTASPSGAPEGQASYNTAASPTSAAVFFSPADDALCEVTGRGPRVPFADLPIQQVLDDYPLS